jgi:uncharacterized damage-inducible protein DinB
MSHDSFEYFLSQVNALPIEKHDWKPMDVGRSAVNQMAEMVQYPQMCTALLRDRSAAFFSDEWLDEQRAWRTQFSNMDELLPMARTAMAELADQVMAEPDETLDQELNLTDVWKSTPRTIMAMTMRNLWFHSGQVALIQMMAGDDTFHKTPQPSHVRSLPAGEFTSFLCDLTDRGMNNLISAVESTREDKLFWSPAEGARSVVGQLVECKQAPGWFQAIADAKDMSPFTKEKREADNREQTERRDWEVLVQELRASCEKYKARLRTMDDDELNHMVDSWVGKVPLSDLLVFPIRNMSWHTGQICYIQTLYGDWDMH